MRRRRRKVVKSSNVVAELVKVERTCPRCGKLDVRDLVRIHEIEICAKCFEEFLISFGVPVLEVKYKKQYIASGADDL